MTNGATEDLVSLSPNDIIRRVLHPFADNEFAVHVSAISELINGTIQDTGTNKIVNVQGYYGSIGTTERVVGSISPAWRPTTAYRLEAVSDSNDDTTTGSGCRRIEIDGLDINGNEITDYLFMSAATPTDPTLLEFWRVNQVRVCCAGTYHFGNAGNITVRIEGAGGNIAVIQKNGSVKFGVSMQGAYTVPAGYTAQLLGGNSFVAGSKPATIILYTNSYANDTEISYSGGDTIQFLAPEVDGAVAIDFNVPILLPEFTDLRFTAYAPSGGSNTAVYVNAQVALFENTRYLAKSQKPVMPFNFEITVGDNVANLSWDALFSADKYRIYYSDTAGVTTASDYIETSNISYVFPLRNGTRKYFRISGVNNGGSNVTEGKLSRELSAYAQANASSYSISLDGSNEHAAEAGGAVADLLDTHTEASVAVWAKRTTAATYGQLFDVYNAKLGLFWLNNDKIRCYARPGLGGAAPSTDTTATYASTTEWYFIVATWDLDAQYQRIYVNGELAIEANVAYSTQVWDDRSGTSYIGINNNGSSYPFPGYIDHVGLWTKRLTEREILQLYNGGNPVDYANDLGYYESASNLEAYWKIGEGDTYPTLTDSVGSADMTLTNTEAADLTNTDYAGA